MKKISIIIISLLILSCDSKTYYSDIENPETFLDKHGGKIWSDNGYNGMFNLWRRGSQVRIYPMEDLDDKNGEILSIGNLPKILNRDPYFSKVKVEYEYPQHLIINHDKLRGKSTYTLNIEQKTNIPFTLTVYRKTFNYNYATRKNDEWDSSVVYERKNIIKDFSEVVYDLHDENVSGLSAFEILITPLSGDLIQNYETSDPFKQEIEFTDISWSIERIRDSYNKKFESDTTIVASLSLGPIKQKFEYFMTRNVDNYLTFI